MSGVGGVGLDHEGRKGSVSERLTLPPAGSQRAHSVLAPGHEKWGAG